MMRILLLAAIVVLAGGVLNDPYTWHLDGSDAFRAAPRWQTGLQLLDFAAFIAAGVCVVGAWLRPAFLILGAEILLCLGTNALLIHRDGFERFVSGFGAQSHLPEYLVLFGLRAVVFVAVAVQLSKAPR